MSETKPSDVIPLGGGSFEVEFVDDDDSENDAPGLKPGMNARDYMMFVSHAARCHDDLLEACKKANTCVSLPDAVKDIVRAAIAKAQGGAA